MTVKPSSVLTAIGGLVVVGSIAIALFAPRFDCRDGWRLHRDIPPPAGSQNGWICSRSDVGYVPHDRRPYELAIGLVGAALGWFVIVAGLRLHRRAATENADAMEEGGAGL